MKIQFSNAQIINVQKKSGVSQKGKSWTSADVLISHDGNNYSLNAFGDLSGGLVVGAVYDFFCELKTQEYNGKNYTKIELGTLKACAKVAPTNTYQKPVPETDIITDIDDLPF